MTRYIVDIHGMVAGIAVVVAGAASCGLAVAGVTVAENTSPAVDGLVATVVAAAAADTEPTTISLAVTVVAAGIAF
jgi:hypothetical protein